MWLFGGPNNPPLSIIGYKHPLCEHAAQPDIQCYCVPAYDPMSGLFRKPMNDEGDVYTSLLSNQSFTAYLPDDLKPSNHSAGSSALDDFTSDTYSFTSKTKTASSLSDNIPKSLLGSDKTESYNYMDISHGEEHCGSRGSAGHDLLGSYMEQNPGRDIDEENLGPALGSHSFPYVEDPSDEELNDYRSYRNLGGTPQTASPVKITLTGSQPSKAEPQLLPPPVGMSERENVLSVGLQGVPTVTLSEPEDDSPASTPNASPTRKQFSSEDMFKVESRKPPASRSNQGPKPSSRDHEGSSAESGDSEIELVSEELPKASTHPFTEEPKNKVTVSQSNNPFDNPPVTKAGFGLAGSPASPTAYSILREEREAELDSDLIIESASEESPKREQSIGGPKQGAPLPSPLVSSTSPPRSTPEAVPVQPLIAEKAKNPVKAEEDPPSKPKPPTAAVPPEVRSEKPQQDDMHKPLQQDKGELGKPAVAMLLEGFNKQKASAAPQRQSLCSESRQHLGNLSSPPSVPPSSTSSQPLSPILPTIHASL
ncbi:hypothetical protein CRENBAI_022981 [Crenichthys baileyi]|uniref:Reticulon-1 n=1 Tax=Crenichthys baileyi TaxID=28760 RepID=A0AAV9RL78_9TELE